MKKITLHAADSTQLASVELKNRKRVLVLPAPDFETGAMIKGLTNYSKGDILEIIPATEEMQLYLKNYTKNTRNSLGAFPTLDSAPRLLTFQDGKYIALTVEDTDEELYTIAKAQAAADNEKQDKYTAAAIIAAVALIIFCAWYFNLAGFLCLLLCLIAL